MPPLLRRACRSCLFNLKKSLKPTCSCYLTSRRSYAPVANAYVKFDDLLAELDKYKPEEGKYMPIDGSFDNEPKIKRKSRRYGDLELVKSLQHPSHRHKYEGSPFYLPNKPKAVYKRDFQKHLILEKEDYTGVKNKWRISEEEPMEEMIERWGWKKSMHDQIVKLFDEVVVEPVNTVLSLVDRDELVKRFYKDVVTWIAESQSLLPIVPLEKRLVSSAWELYKREYEQRHEIYRDEVLTEVYDKYLDYFCEEEFSRQYTHREHWEECMASLDERKRSMLLKDAELSKNEKLFKDKAAPIILNAISIACQVPIPISKNRVRNQPAFSYASVTQEEKSEVSSEPGEVRYTPTKMLRLNQKLLKVVEKHRFENIYFENYRLPMLVPPKPWLDKGRGGPFFTREAKIFREKREYFHISVNKEFKDYYSTNQHFEDEMDADNKKTRARPVFDALNDLGITPWIVNSSMLNVVKELFDRSWDKRNEKLLKIVNMPLHPSTVEIPVLDKTRMLPLEEHVAKKTAYFKAIKTRNEYNSLHSFMLYRIVLADLFKDKVLYFPHNMDFRGRVYPISPYLNHMGDDFNRCLLLFARGRPLGYKGLYWLKLHTVNMYGHLKRESYDTRMQYFEENVHEIIDSAERPFDGKQWWLTADSPLLALASAIEVRNALSLNDPSQYVSHLPIHQDGSCNGLQHYAALGRDEEGGRVVNLLPSERPQDVYSAVAERVEAKRVFDEENEIDEAKKKLLASFRHYLPQPIPRKVIKQTVMTTVYGVTLIGAIAQIDKQLKALDIPEDESYDFAKYLAKTTFDCLGDTFKVSMEIKKWFRLCASAITSKTSGLNKLMKWQTPLGLPVIQPYSTSEYTDEPHLVAVNMKQRDAFPPNFVHSLDSTHMMLTTLHCRKHGLTFAAVHDCYWTHGCSVPIMNEICREQFIALYKTPIIENLSNEMKRMLVELKEDRSNVHKLDDLFTPKFEKGKLDIEKIKDSVYFFS